MRTSVQLERWPTGRASAEGNACDRMYCCSSCGGDAPGLEPLAGCGAALHSPVTLCHSGSKNAGRSSGSHSFFSLLPASSGRHK